jgi:ABC-2 type transport system permease protein
VNGFAGTRRLLRLALRLDRVRLTVWVLVLASSPLATAAQYQKLYPTPQSLAVVEGVVSNTSLVALNGPLFRVSLGGLTAWKIMATELILVALMSLLTVVRHTRADEEAGRLELLGATVVGRYAPLTAALATAVLADAVIAVLIALGLLGIGLPAAGAVAMGLGVGLTGLVFAAVAAVTAQLSQSARTANAIAAATLGAAYLLRAVGDTGPVALTWLSPVGWAMRIRPYAGERWWVVVLPVALAGVLGAVGYALVAGRDLDAGLLPQRPGPARAAAWLATPLALAWRLHRGLLVGWVVAMAVSGAVLGGSAHSLTGSLGDNRQLADMLARMGGSKGLTDEYLAAVFGIIGLVCAAYTVQAVLRLRAEESSGRVEPLLATRVGRIRWAASHLAFAVGGTGLLLLVAGAAGGLAYGVQEHDLGTQVPRLIGAALVQLPAALVLAGLGTALVGLAPRASGLSWAALVLCTALLELGALLDLDQRIVDVSPFAHLPKLPGSAFTATPVLWLLAVAAALGVAGLAALRRRDMPVA